MNFLLSTVLLLCTASATNMLSKRKNNHFHIEMTMAYSHSYQLVFGDSNPIAYISRGAMADAVQNNFQCNNDDCEENYPQYNVSIYTTQRDSMKLSLLGVDGESYTQLYDDGAAGYSFSMSWDGEGGNVIFYQNDEAVYAYCNPGSSSQVGLDVVFSGKAPSGQFVECIELFGFWEISW